ncbi:MAG: cysteine--tRNA ligase [Planctomycetia bacterium]|nr:cysteine--tRNA ligase [Planctomycetia bacterium]
MIQVFNTLSKSKEEFTTVTGTNQVGMYLCGPTVYKPSHIGHMVGPVIFDTVKRYLVYNGYDVRFIINITDVDDKLINESNARGMSMSALAEEMIQDYQSNIAALNVKTVSDFPRATDHIKNMIPFIQRLIDRGYAYPADGDVYFDVAKFPEYGKLSNRTLEQMQGEGGSTASQKRNSADFALWKAAKPGEPSWESPWGPGRPGWHIECSVMCHEMLGDTFEIHGGGLDLMFPHHENEIAQSECCTGKPYVKYWMHNGLMQASSEIGKVGGRKTREAAPSEGDLASQEGGKISKSKGAAAFKDMLKEFTGENIRFFVLSTHYRRPIDYSNERIQQIGAGMEAFYRFFKRYQRVTGNSIYDLDYAHDRAAGDAYAAGLAGDFLASVIDSRSRFVSAMDDDFNTGGAIGELFELVKRLNKFVDETKLEETRDAQNAEQLTVGCRILRELASILGVFETEIETQDEGADSTLVNDLMELVIELRKNAKKAKDFAAADLIRDRLKTLGITLEDRPGGVTEWSK